MKRMRMRRRWRSQGMSIVPSCGRGRAVPAAAASASATAGKMEAISYGCGLRAGGCKGTVAIRQSWADLIGSGVLPRLGAAVSTNCVVRGSVPEICEGAFVSDHEGETFAWAAFECRGRRAKVYGAARVGRVWVTVSGGCAVGREALCCGCLWVLGWRGGSLSRGPGLCRPVGECRRLGEEWGGRGRGCGAGFVCGVLAFVVARRVVDVWSCVPLDVWR